MKVLYKPIGLIVSVLGGILASQLFSQLWRLLPGSSESAPESKDPGHSWKEIATAAALQGAVYGSVKAIVDRAGARGFERMTGTWPS
jgi:Protein of unknown function (DUF4235)